MDDMDIDIAGKIGAVEREVTDGERDGRPTRVVVATRSYPAGIADVWDAITNAERIPRWLTPVSGDLRLGGRYQLEGNAGGEITVCRPPHHLAVTWEFGGDVTWVEVSLTEDADGTRLQLRHAAHPGDHWDQFGPGAVGVGWDLALLGLDYHLATGEGPIDAAAWMASPEGKAYIRDSGEGWGRADIAGGAPEAEALEAAARTTAAFTGEG